MTYRRSMLFTLLFLIAAHLEAQLSVFVRNTSANPVPTTGTVTTIDSTRITETVGKVRDALPAGTNNIGDVDVLTLPNVTLTAQTNPFTTPIPISDNAGSITVDVGAALPAGTANIGDVDVLTLPALPAGTANIGDVDVASTVHPTGLTTVGSAQATVTTAGTAVQLGTNAAKFVTVKAFSTNTGIIYVGPSTVTSANGFELSSKETVTAPVDNTNRIWINASVSGEKASYLWTN